ncbi:hypothetical protein TWF730_006128 [Orbilia blumenaviensis]|uniref:Uncharacterized protein n=1 Tax=Orbilia blumenaviensis TaxID=1796055 RepID=A0AAV9U0Q3_9PEZI
MATLAGSQAQVPDLHAQLKEACRVRDQKIKELEVAVLALREDYSKRMMRSRGRKISTGLAKDTVSGYTMDRNISSPQYPLTIVHRVNDQKNQGARDGKGQLRQKRFNVFILQNHQSESVYTAPSRIIDWNIPSLQLPLATVDVLSTNNAGVLSINNAGVLSTNNAGVLSTNNAGVLSINNAGVLSTNNAGVLSTNNAGVLSTNNAGVLSTNNAGGVLSTNNAGVLSTSNTVSACVSLHLFIRS